MLDFLKISNLALLSGAEIDFSSGFTAITGETGAGKSVLLGALSLLAGAKCGREIIGRNGDFCSVEAAISISEPSKINEFLAASGLRICEDGVLLLSRYIYKEKAGRIFVNSSLSSLSTLSKIGEFWIDFHGPGEPQKLFSANNQLDMLDSFAGQAQLRETYIDLYRSRLDLLRRIEELKNLKKLSSDEIDYIKNQISAIDALEISADSIAKLEEVSKLVEMSSDIAEKSMCVSNLLSGDSGASDSVSAAVRLASELSSIGERGADLYGRLSSLSVELSDIAADFEALAASCDMSPEYMADIRKKMSDWLALTRKYGPSPEAVLNARSEMAEKIAAQGDVGSSIKALSDDAASLLEEMKPLSDKIFKLRTCAAGKLSCNVVKILKRLGFAKARFNIAVSPLQDASLSCGSRCEFLFSANPGQGLLPLSKIASSGELARVMLALKTVLADADRTPVLVFDEVDANVGGEIGAEVGSLLKKISERHQVFCVTHLPQVAARAENHFLVEKFQTKTLTNVKISDISGNETRRISELARMLGDRNSDSAIAHAKKLLFEK